MTLSIVAFLEARLDEDEAAAREAAEAADGNVWTDFVYSGQRFLSHIERHDPARVLREVEAKRVILELADEASGLDISVDIDRRVGPRDTAEEPYVGDLIIRQMAAAWSDHKDYNPTWSPE